MNRERAKELLPIIQAFAEGKIIQARAGESAGWNSYEHGAETGFLDDFEYRIKPEPRVFWLIEHQDGSISFQADVAPIGASKFIEVLEDD